MSQINNLIPSKFTIANHTIDVVIENVVTNANSTDRSFYGQWIDPKNKIILYRTVILETDEVVTLSDEQILNTFYHELMHCFMFFAGLERSEQTAQTFANFIREFQATKS